MSAPLARPLRVGIVVASAMQPAWVHSVVSDLQSSPVVDLAVVLCSPPRRGVRGNAAGTGRHALYALYTALDRRLFGAVSSSGARLVAAGEVPKPDALAIKDLSDLVAGVPEITVGTSDPSLRLQFSAADVEGIVASDLDVIVSFDPRPVSATEGVARFGTWSYAFGEVGSSVDPGFWEVMEGAPVTQAALQVSTGGTDQPRSICRSFSNTDKYSVARNQNNVYWTSSAFVLRSLQLIHEGRAESPEQLAGASLDLPYSGPPRIIPTNAQMCAHLSRHAARIVRDRVRHKARPDRWVLAYHLGTDVVPISDFVPLLPYHPTHQWADPFPVRFEDEYYLFFEEQFSSSDPAHISMMKLEAGGRWSEPVIVLESEHHLSYPNVFRCNDTFFMIPETSQAGRIELYQSTKFPFAWELATVLVDDINGVDATIAQVGDLWWLFVNTAADGARNWEELRLYSAAAPTGPWQPHRDNPVRTDARNTRPAGQLFDWHGRLLRPAQDCGGRYGRAVVIHEVLRLDSEGFEEREVGRIEPDWNSRTVGVHTFNAVPGLTVIDCLQSDH